jgi:outer membrane protein assembly factor BamB
MKVAISILSSMFLIGNVQNTKVNPVPIENTFPINWVVDIGNTTYRSDVAHLNGKLIIGSNGENYRDYYLDEGNGVYVINPINGKIETQFLNEEYGDMDVNGVLEYNERLFIGNDNDEFICADITGKIIYRLPVSGDIEHSPILIKNGSQNTIVYATESGEITSIHPETGKKIWTYFHKDFKGWKPGDNRFIFQVKSTYINSGQLFFGKPGVADLNRDGVVDLVYYTNYNETIAIDGKTGKKLWSHKKEEGSNVVIDYQDTPIIVGAGNDIRIIKLASIYSDESTPNKLMFYNRNGDFVKEIPFNRTIGYLGLNTLDLKKQLIIPLSNGIAVYDKNTQKVDFISGLNKMYPSTYGSGYSTRLGGQPLVANRTFQYNGELCIVVLHQSDYNTEHKGAISIIGLKSKKRLKFLHLPSSSEFKPLIKDFNKDGELDLLVNCRDGKLYCFDLKISDDNLTINQ